jgi:WD40 repeat protein
MNKLLYSISADHTARCWVIDVGDCTRIYKGHHHSVSCIQIDSGLGMIIFFIDSIMMIFLISVYWLW